MIIRNMKKGDIPSAMNIVELNYDKEEAIEIGNMFKDLPIKPSYLVAINEKTKEFLGYGGFIQSMMSYAIYELFSINVHPRNQRKGIGIEIVNNLIKEIKAIRGKNKEAHRIALTCEDKLVRFYEKFGFRVLDRFNSGSDNLMVLDLEKQE